MNSTSQAAQEVSRQAMQGLADAKELLLQLRRAFQTLPAKKREELKDTLREGIAMLEMEQPMHSSGQMPSLTV